MTSCNCAIVGYPKPTTGGVFAESSEDSNIATLFLINIINYKYFYKVHYEEFCNIIIERSIIHFVLRGKFNFIQGYDL